MTILELAGQVSVYNRNDDVSSWPHNCGMDGAARLAGRIGQTNRGQIGPDSWDEVRIKCSLSAANGNQGSLLAFLPLVWIKRRGWLGLSDVATKGGR